MQAAYRELAKYYDLIFQEKNYRAESEFIRKIVGKRMPTAKSVLDVGCGTGNHLNLLLGKFDILYGVDLNPEIIKEAKKKSRKITYLVGDMANFLIDWKFDVITCLYSVFNYNLSDKDARKTLRNIKKHLKKNGLVIFALYTPHNTDAKISLHVGKNKRVQIAKINQCVYDPKTCFEICSFLVLIKAENRFDFFVEKGHKYRIYEVDEFSNLLAETGFADIETFDNYTEKPATDKTKYPLIIANLKKQY